VRTIKILLVILSLACTVFAQNTDWIAFMTNSPTASMKMTLPQADQANHSSADRPDGYKSPKKALGLSALLPGAGQAYAGSYLKTAGFIAVEAMGWTIYTVYNKKGNDIDKEFKAYADAHWSESEYWDWISRHSGIDRNDMDALREWEKSRFSHHLHLDKDQQYYEMIGKYDQFNYGWDDSDIGLLDEGWNIDQRSQHRLYYEDRRHDSNAALKTATTGLTLVMFNHILSAIDAAWTVSRHNRQLAKVSLYFQPLQYDRQSVTALTLNVDW